MAKKAKIEKRLKSKKNRKESSPSPLDKILNTARKHSGKHQVESARGNYHKALSYKTSKIKSTGKLKFMNFDSLKKHGSKRNTVAGNKSPRSSSSNVMKKFKLSLDSPVSVLGVWDVGEGSRRWNCVYCVNFWASKVAFQLKMC